ncbi:protein FAF-like, chloroplastic [Ricinus communis]|uniref:FAF domain-containing protein n=1 Tax=Ricinus communis TaxID=3988 RepID=B9RJ16_RICCO|nr:protein FAF-like, chloroplastic [Ricinus communis]EEF48682.1 conserved hypothetical protein [Ricinus communis]|eukprot:XP_002513735.1 protein FAF-like, chloroplastic [Ricinus communis]
MSSAMSKNFRLSSPLKEEVLVTKKQGIVSILGSDYERTKSAPSLRRTLSADMSSKKWQSQHGFSPLKKIASSGEFPISITDSSSSSPSSLEGEYERESRGRFEIWSSIQEEKEKKDQENPGQFDIWSSILTQKAQEDTKTLPPPYVHPLVKRSASSLSEKSLEICTESLGSENGSDGFSSYPPSETGEAEEDKEEEQEQEEQEQEERATPKYDMEDLHVAKYNFAASATKKSSPKSFPPPLPSLSSRDGASLRMKPRRDNGRLVLEAVSVPSQNNFQAQRQDGRLVLTFADSLNKEGQKGAEMFEIEIENSEDESETETEEEEVEMEMEEAANERGRGAGGSGDVRFVMEQAPKLSGGVINVHRLALMMNKPMLISNRNPTWPNKFNEVQFEEGVEEVVKPITPLTQSLPPRPPVARMIPMPSTAVAAAGTVKAAAAAAAAASSFNAYEYYWKPKPMGTAGATTAAVSLSPITQKSSLSSSSLSKKDSNNRSILSKNLMVNEKQELLVLRGNKGDYLVPLSKGCKEPRRSLLFWEPYCIATS